MTARKIKWPSSLPRLVLENIFIGTLVAGMVGVFLRIYLAHLNALRLDWAMFVFIGMAIGFLSGFERVRFERLRREKKSLEMELGRIDRALEITRRRHESLLARIPDWIFQTNREFRLIESSRAGEDIFGYRRLKGENQSFFEIIPARFYPELRRDFTEVLAGKSQLIELEIANPPERRRYFSLVLYPARDANKETTGVAGIMRDISERKRLEKELLQAEKMAEMGTMAASVAHEIRNPLGIIRTAIFNLNRRLSEKDYPLKKHVANIEQKVDEADTIITSLLNYSRLREAVLIETDINKLLEESLEQITEQFSDYDITAVKKLRSLPPIKVDRVHLSGVFQNLIKNAYEAMGKSGELMLATDYIPKSGILEVSISDTGCGIPAENRKKIGKPFFSTKAKGVGLGLALSYRIVEEIHKGSIEVESEEGKGSLFKIKLPYRVK